MNRIENKIRVVLMGKVYQLTQIIFFYTISAAVYCEQLGIRPYVRVRVRVRTKSMVDNFGASSSTGRIMPCESRNRTSKTDLYHPPIT